MVHVSASEGIPEKRRTHWKSATAGQKRLILHVPLLAEVVCRIILVRGSAQARDRVRWLMRLPTSGLVQLGDEEALGAGENYDRHARGHDPVSSMFSA